MRISTIGSLCVVLAASIGHARAQSFNIDVDVPGQPGAGLPSSGLAAAGLPGVWNAVSFNSTALALIDVHGATTSATFTNTGGGVFSFDNPNTSGDDGLLLDDVIDPGLAAHCTIAHLVAGTYTVLTYAWAPDNAVFLTGVSVNGSPVSSVGGIFSGSYVVGITHARNDLVVPAGGSITITFSIVNAFSSFNGVQILRQGDITTSCESGPAFGASCPCGTNGGPGRGCPNSADATGAVLTASGVASFVADTFSLAGASMPATGTCLYFQGTHLTSAATFGDGLSCVAGTMTRLAVRTNTGGASAYPVGAEPRISLRGGATPGALLGYQVLYRDAPSFCTSATFNLTNGVVVAWAP
jgi:hypothetical protein